MHYFSCAPTNKFQLKKYATNIRSMFKCDKLKFPIIDVLDMMQDNEEFLGFEYEIMDDNDPVFMDGELAKYDFSSNTMFIKESQFNGACDDDPRCRFTLTHELSHFFLMEVTGRHPIDTEEKPMAYQDPEWQANCLAGYLLVPPEETKGMSVEEIEKECVVSPECATYAAIKRIRDNRNVKEQSHEH
ncbi:MAG: ImmA/IrrE family metallo-endopeptidase [Bacilli bacterium]|jgi:Zn-dependent peptidase ImmA (M78 family)